MRVYKIFTLVLGVTLLAIFIPRLVYQVENMENSNLSVQPAQTPTPTDNVLALAIEMNDRLKKLEATTKENTKNIDSIQKFINNTKAQLEEQVGSTDTSAQ